MKKIILIAALCLSTSSIMAQENEYITYPFKWGMGMEFGYGSDSHFDIAVRGQYYINKYLTWDALQLRAIDFGKNTIDNRDYSERGLFTTGLRAYTPTFGPGLKAFASAGAGWGIYYTWDKPEKKFTPIWKNHFYNVTHNLAADFSAGLFVWNCLYVSYGCQLLHNNTRGNDVNHFVNVGVEFGSLKFKE